MILINKIKSGLRFGPRDPLWERALVGSAVSGKEPPAPSRQPSIWAHHICRTCPAGRYLSDHVRGSGEPGWRLPIPYWLAFAVVRLAFVTVFRRATKVPTILSPRRFEAMLEPLRFENRRLRQTLGWTPPLDYRQCLARTYGPVAPPTRR